MLFRSLLRSGIVKRCWKIRTPAGWVKLNSQDWILTDVNGNYDTLGDEAFRAQFVEVDAKNQAHGVVTKEQLAFRAAMVISIKQFKDKNLVRVSKLASGQGVLLYFADGTKGELDATTALDILKYL